MKQTEPKSITALPRTGQTTSYRAGDDGTFQAGLPRDGARFIDNGDGTITDFATGLTWIKDPGAPFDAVMDWNDAVDNCLALTFAGHSDWRLPNAFELYSLVDVVKFNPCIDAVFLNTVSARYWSSSTYDAGTDNAWVVEFLMGTISVLLKSNNNMVRPVRGGLI